MDYRAFKKLKAKAQIDYVYHYCSLVDFCVVREKYQQYGMCLYYNGKLFIEVCFDGMRGDRIKLIRAYTDIKQLSHWYERINLGSLLSQKEI